MSDPAAGMWYQREVKIIPSLIIGCGGSGVSVIRHLKRRVRLAWDGDEFSPIPDMIQCYGMDTVSYANRVDQEFLSPGEYGFMGGFDPQELINNPASYPSVNHWWDFDPKALPGGLIHLGARQIRPLGRLAFYYAYPELWRTIKDKIDIINQIAPATQAVRAGYNVPIDTSSRQIFVVSSICGGTGAGCFLDIAARIRAYATTGLKIIGILVLPSAFERELPSRRQVERTQANAYAAIKELDAFWYSEPNPSSNGGQPGAPLPDASGRSGTASAPGRQRFETLFPGDSSTTKLGHALFDEIYLVGREGRGRALTNVEDVAQQIAHFLYLTTIHNVAGPLGERTVNLDRTRQYYSSFAVGALSLPDRKLSASLHATLQARLLDNLANDPRARDRGEALSNEIDGFETALLDRATALSADLGDKPPEIFNDRVRPYREVVALETMRWVFRALLPVYGLDSIVTAFRELQKRHDEYQEDLGDLMEELIAARANKLSAERSLRFGRIGEAWANLRRTKTPQEYEREIKNLEGELAQTNMLVGDPDDSRSGDRLFTFALDVLRPLNGQVERFKAQAQRLSGHFKQEALAALARQADVASPRGRGREYNYYSLEIDPSLPGSANAFDAYWSRIASFEHLRALVDAEGLLAPLVDPAGLSVTPPALVQLLGLFDGAFNSRRTGHLNPVAEVSRLLGRDGRPSLIDREDWEIESMVQEHVRGHVETTLRQEAGMMQFFEQPRYQNERNRTTMRAGLEAILKNLMNHVRPFWGVKPFPDERNLEPVRFLSLAQDPQANPVARQLLSEFWPTSYPAVRGEDPFRLDVLYMEHGARPRHVAELRNCRKIYTELFKDVAERAQLHLSSRYVAELPDPFDIDQPAPVGGHANTRSQLSGTAGTRVPRGNP